MATIQQPQNNVITLTIANGVSLSDLGQIGGRNVCGLITPPGWTAASLTFSACFDGATFSNIYDDATERAIANASIGAGLYLSLDARDWTGIGLLRLRSGTGATPVNQGADRIFQIVLQGK